MSKLEKVIWALAIVSTLLLLFGGRAAARTASVPRGVTVPAPADVPHVRTSPPPVPVPTVPVVLDDVAATTFTVTPDAPRWVWNGKAETVPISVATLSGGQPTAVYDAPGDRVVATLPTRQLSDPTTVPVVGQQPGWVRVLLPSRLAVGTGANGASGWLPSESVVVSPSTWRVTVDLTAQLVTVTHDGSTVGTAQVGVGADKTPTPTGVTWVLSRFGTDQGQGMGLPVVATGSHSEALTTFDGGPATVALHAASVHEGRVSNGCIRLAPADVNLLNDVPVGTPIVIVRS